MALQVAYAGQKTLGPACINTCGPFFPWSASYGLTLIPAWLSNYIHCKVWDEITYPFLNSNGDTVEVKEWIGDVAAHFTGHVITYSCWD